MGVQEVEFEGGFVWTVADLIALARAAGRLSEADERFLRTLTSPSI